MRLPNSNALPTRTVHGARVRVRASCHPGGSWRGLSPSKISRTVPRAPSTNGANVLDFGPREISFASLESAVDLLLYWRIRPWISSVRRTVDRGVKKRKAERMPVGEHESDPLKLTTVGFGRGGVRLVGYRIASRASSRGRGWSVPSRPRSRRAFGDRAFGALRIEREARRAHRDGVRQRDARRVDESSRNQLEDALEVDVNDLQTLGTFINTAKDEDTSDLSILIEHRHVVQVHRQLRAQARAGEARGQGGHRERAGRGE